MFKVDQIYKSRLHFKKHLNYFAECWGFTVARAGHDYNCSRGGCAHVKKIRPKLGVRKTTPNKIGCEWKIRLRPLSAKLKRSFYNDHSTDLGFNAIIIKHVVAVHSNGCFPGRNQYIICKKKQEDMQKN